MQKHRKKMEQSFDLLLGEVEEPDEIVTASQNIVTEREESVEELNKTKTAIEPSEAKSEGVTGEIELSENDAIDEQQTDEESTEDRTKEAGTVTSIIGKNPRSC